MVEANHKRKFTSTRYQGSKRRFVDWITNEINGNGLEYQSVLDVFGGTGAMSYSFKALGKNVYYNDILKSNFIIGKALIENDSTKVDITVAKSLIKRKSGIKYSSFVQDNFNGIYYLDDEDKWIDIVRTNIQLMDNEYQQAIAYFALFQSCLIKRPYNLFHRKNLYFRTRNWGNVSFGNKTTWEKPFRTFFIKFIEEANNAVFSNENSNRALNYDVMHIPNQYHSNLTYMDPPYMNKDGYSPDYLDYYHFLDGLTLTDDEWKSRIDNVTKHKRLKIKKTKWTDKNKIDNAFNDLFKKYQNSIIVLSYRDPGLPSIDKLEILLREYKKKVIICDKFHNFALAKKSEEDKIKHNRQILFIGTDE
jgi:adenine-specific DNA methylase